MAATGIQLHYQTTDKGPRHKLILVQLTLQEVRGLTKLGIQTYYQRWSQAIIQTQSLSHLKRASH
jgi:hypothetical protein